MFKKIYQNKQALISLCKGLKGIKNIKEEDIQITTLSESNALYVQIRNDLSFIIGTNIFLFEQQSDINPNMPVRHASYFFNTLSELFGNLTFHSKTLQKIPRSILITFTNGNPKNITHEVLKLSDMFQESTKSEEAHSKIKINGRNQNYIEVYVEVIYLNHPDNKELLDKIPTLKGFAFFTQSLKKYRKENYSKNTSVEKAIEDTINQNLLVDLLVKEREKIKSLIMSQITQEEWNTFKHNEGFNEGIKQGISQGIEQGVEQGLIRAAISLLDILDDKTISEKINLSIDEVIKLRQQYNK
ncbi:hypothetical protein AN641_08730 [Candidatus Epulonipiscioides gigas]|nr:hypothetical protein AN641_08730 [Epulopiscium sp. SCG-C07WGA-EpuloA2]